VVHEPIDYDWLSSKTSLSAYDANYKAVRRLMSERNLGRATAMLLLAKYPIDVGSWKMRIW